MKIKANKTKVTRFLLWGEQKTQQSCVRSFDFFFFSLSSLDVCLVSLCAVIFLFFFYKLLVALFTIVALSSVAASFAVLIVIISVRFYCVNIFNRVIFFV